MGRARLESSLDIPRDVLLRLPERRRGKGCRSLFSASGLRSPSSPHLQIRAAVTQFSSFSLHFVQSTLACCLGSFSSCYTGLVNGALLATPAKKLIPLSFWWLWKAARHYIIWILEILDFGFLFPVLLQKRVFKCVEVNWNALKKYLEHTFIFYF